jgi:hypothetical protein
VFLSELLDFLYSIAIKKILLPVCLGRLESKTVLTLEISYAGLATFEFEALGQRMQYLKPLIIQFFEQDPLSKK